MFKTRVEQFDIDKQVYTICQEIIMEYHADMEMLKIELSDLEQRLNSFQASRLYKIN